MVDASRLMDIKNQEHQAMVRRQIKAANQLIQNKTDCIDGQKLDTVRRLVRNISPGAVILESMRCRIPVYI